MVQAKRNKQLRPCLLGKGDEVACGATCPWAELETGSNMLTVFVASPSSVREVGSQLMILIGYTLVGNVSYILVKIKYFFCHLKVLSGTRVRFPASSGVLLCLFFTLHAQAEKVLGPTEVESV